MSSFFDNRKLDKKTQRLTLDNILLKLNQANKCLLRKQYQKPIVDYAQITRKTYTKAA